MRSSWKLKPVDASFFRKSWQLKFYNRGVSSPQMWIKGTRIFSNLLEKNLLIYNGLKFVELSVKKEMLGFFLGSFVLTKRMTSDIHSKTRKNKKGRQKKKKK